MSQKIVKSREFLSSSSDSSSSDNDNENVTPSQLHKKYEKTKKPQVKKVDKKRKEQLKSIGEDSDSSSDGEDRDGGKHEPPKKLSKIEKIKSSQKSIQKSKSEEKIEEPKEKKKDKKEKKQKKETNPSVNKDTYQVQLGNSGKKYVRYNSFKGTSYCDIRELYEKDGKLCPGAKGISLKKEIVEVLFEEETKEKVKENLDALRGGAKETPVFALGGSKIKMGIRKFKTFLLIDIREYYDDKKSGEEKPGKKGISLNPDQWNALVSESANILGLFA